MLRCTLLLCGIDIKPRSCLVMAFRNTLIKMNASEYAQNYRMAGVEKDLWRSRSPTPPLKQVPCSSRLRMLKFSKH